MATWDSQPEGWPCDPSHTQCSSISRLRAFLMRMHIRFRRIFAPSAYARLKWLKIMMHARDSWCRKSASGQFRATVCAWRNILLLLTLNQSCMPFLPLFASIPLCIRRKSMILKERREGDSFRLPDNGVCKLQIQHCQCSQDCHTCHGALP
jgi:hypothetical protein